MEPRVFIFEGMDYSGKTSVVKFVAEALEKRYPGKVSTYRSPGGTELGEKVRDIARIDAGSVETQTMAYLTAIMSVYERVKQDIEDKKIVLLDRWVHSTMAYQIMMMKNQPVSKATTDICTALMGFPLYSLFFFELTMHELQRRINAAAAAKADTVDRFEAGGHEYRRSVMGNYDVLMANRLRTSSANDLVFQNHKTLEMLQDNVLIRVLSFLEPVAQRNQDYNLVYYTVWAAPAAKNAPARLLGKTHGKTPLEALKRFWDHHSNHLIPLLSRHDDGAKLLYSGADVSLVVDETKWHYA